LKKNIKKFIDTHTPQLVLATWKLLPIVKHAQALYHLSRPLAFVNLSLPFVHHANKTKTKQNKTKKIERESGQHSAKTKTRKEREKRVHFRPRIEKEKERKPTERERVGAWRRRRQGLQSTF
jgi:hypothetical protein